MRSSRPPPPSDWQIYRRAIAIALLGLGGTAALVSVGEAVEPARVLARFAAPSTPSIATRSAPALEPAPLTDALRVKGFHECNPHDPIGLGPYAPFRNLNVGRIAIPQKGGFTDDMGYDVIVHFHGHSPVRKTLVQVARGVAFVGIDKGIGSGRYSKPFENPETWRTLLRSIEGALVKHSGDERAHVRKLGLSAWSAGYGAVNEILKYDADRVDAVVLLDGLHAAWNPAAPKRDGSLRSLSSRTIEPTFRYARRALAGEKLFIFTHSRVDPEKYPSTEATANLLLSELGLERTPLERGSDPFGKTGAAERKGFHLWSYAGPNEAAHCTHIRHIAPALRVVEEAWQTPALDRSVPFTPAPKLGGSGSDAEEMPVIAFESADGGTTLPLEEDEPSNAPAAEPELPAVEPAAQATPAAPE